MNILKPEERLVVYQKMVELLPQRVFIGLCSILQRALFEKHDFSVVIKSPLIEIGNFSELIEQKPAGISTWEYWWGDGTECAPRLEALEKAITKVSALIKRIKVYNAMLVKIRERHAMNLVDGGKQGLNFCSLLDEVEVVGLFNSERVLSRYPELMKYCPKGLTTGDEWFHPLEAQKRIDILNEILNSNL